VLTIGSTARPGEAHREELEAWRDAVREAVQ